MTRPEARPVWLFPTRMDADCVRDAQPVLTQEGIPYQLSTNVQILSGFPGVQSVRVRIKRGEEAAFTENSKPDQVRI